MTDSRPLISLVIAVYGVEAYLPAFLSSLEAQDLSDVELIFVDDGSPDRSSLLIAAWLERSTAHTSRLLHQANGGAASARNTGMTTASGDWISFPDPDDILAAGYLGLVRAAIHGADAAVALIATPLIVFNEQENTFRNSHPLRGMFNGGAQRIDLSEQPAAIKISGATSFIRREVLETLNITFDTDLRPNFEDADVVTRYLASFEQPVVQTVPAAHYYYRSRADASSLVSSSWSKPEKYTTVPARGWLRLAEDLVAARGTLPRFVQNVLLYDISWYFSTDARIHTPTKGLSDVVCRTFIDILTQVLRHIDSEAIFDYAASYLSNEVRLGLVALKGDDLSNLPVTLWRFDERRGLAQVKYYTTSASVTQEVFSVDGLTITPKWSKFRGIHYFRSVLLYERIAWVPYREGIRIEVDGIRRRFQLATDNSASWTLSPLMARRVGFRGAYPQPAASVHTTTTRWAHWKQRADHRVTQVRRILQGNSPRFYRLSDRLTKAIAKKTRRYADAWIFMDRDTQAQDNAEHLYRWVAANHPEVNSWFVVSRRSPDWKRLKAEGFRLVAFGSWQHTLLLLRARHLASSHIDRYVVQPLHPKRFPGRKWAFTFLQHGVTKDDISRWLNSKPIRRIITVGAAEQESFTGDGSPYVLTERESALTGFPRHDELIRMVDTTPDKRPYILVIPTWREYLLGPATGRGNARALAPGFEESTYVRAWSEFLSSERLRQVAAESGKSIVFVSHPNLEPHIGRMNLPPYIIVKTYATTNIQHLIANGATLVTDYSSIAFDSAFIETPCVYYHFDQEEFFRDHPHRPGYFSYREHGFGPVSTDADGVIDAISSALVGDDTWASYKERAAGFFAYRDTGSCERVFQSMQEIDVA